MSTFENASHTVSRFSQVTLNLIEDQTFLAISQLSSAVRSTTPLQAFDHRLEYRQLQNSIKTRVFAAQLGHVAH